MIGLAGLETGIREGRRFELIDAAYLHRASREDDFALARGRDAVLAATLSDLAEDGHGPVRILHDLDDMIVFETHKGWRGHRWVRRERGMILEETLIRDGEARARAAGRDPDAEALRLGSAHPQHAPMGEYRTGFGQCAVGDHAELPLDFPELARPFADELHRAWNGRRLGGIGPRRWRGPGDRTGDAGGAADWLGQLAADLPDAVVMFERALVVDGAAALLWRLHGQMLGRPVRPVRQHHADGREWRGRGRGHADRYAGASRDATSADHRLSLIS